MVAWLDVICKFGMGDRTGRIEGRMLLASDMGHRLLKNDRPIFCNGVSFPYIHSMYKKYTPYGIRDGKCIHIPISDWRRDGRVVC